MRASNLANIFIVQEKFILYYFLLTMLNNKRHKPSNVDLTTIAEVYFPFLLTIVVLDFLLSRLFNVSQPSLLFLLFCSLVL
jgi:hypothetical protein